MYRCNAIPSHEKVKRSFHGKFSENTYCKIYLSHGEHDVEFRS